MRSQSQSVISARLMSLSSLSQSGSKCSALPTSANFSSRRSEDTVNLSKEDTSMSVYTFSKLASIIQTLFWRQTREKLSSWGLSRKTDNKLTNKPPIHVNRKYKDGTSLILFVPFLAMQTYFWDDNNFFVKHATLLILSNYSEKNNFASCN